MRLDLSVCIITDKMTETMDQTISQLSDLVNEIIILDTSGRLEFKPKIASHLNIKVITSLEKNNFSGWRNFCITQAQSEWILFLDSDEQLSKELLNNLPDLICPKGKSISKGNQSDIDGYQIRRIDFFHNKQIRYGEVGRVYKLRLARKNKYSFSKPVHEVGQVSGKVKKIDLPIYHYPHLDFSSFFNKINHYSYLQAKNQTSYNKLINLIKFFLFPTGKFIVNYIFKLGFLDGFRGFIYAFMMSLHSLSVRIYLYEINQKN